MLLHLLGNLSWVKSNSCIEIGKKYNIPIIEDACEIVGGKNNMDSVSISINHENYRHAAMLNTDTVKELIKDFIGEI